jgi:hypothetical protein
MNNKKVKKYSLGGPANLLGGSLMGANPLIGLGLNMLTDRIQQEVIGNQRRNSIVSGTPGTYNTGGFIQKENIKNTDKNKLKAIQLDLKNRGLYSGKIDGIYGPLTERAINLYNSETIVDKNLPEVEIKAPWKDLRGPEFRYPSPPKSSRYMDTEGVRADRRTIGEDYVPLGRQSNTTSPRGLEESGKAILSKGSKGEEVIQLQELLKEKGLYKGKIDGVYGEQTKKAVTEFQKYINTAPDFFRGY